MLSGAKDLLLLLPFIQPALSPTELAHIMGMDIRLPLGLIFAILGAIMAIYGLATRHASMYDMAGGLNINILWGSVMLAGGLLTLIYMRLTRKPR